MPRYVTVILKNQDSNGLSNILGGNDLGMTHPQQIQLFGKTDGRLDIANVLSLENAFIYLFFISMLCLQLYICL